MNNTYFYFLNKKNIQYIRGRIRERKIMDPNRLSERRKIKRRKINNPVSIDRRKGDRREGKERRDRD